MVEEASTKAAHFRIPIVDPLVRHFTDPIDQTSTVTPAGEVIENAVRLFHLNTQSEL